MESNLSELGRAALEYIEEGYKVFPLKEREKAPATRHGFQDASNNREQIIKWWTENPNYNIGVSMGDPDKGGSGVYAIDVDYKKDEHGNVTDGRPVVERLVSSNGPMGGVSFKTGSGYQILYTWEDEFSPPRAAQNIREGIDIRSTGSYSVVPPSIHPNGSFYEWIEGSLDYAPGFVTGFIKEAMSESAVSRNGAVQQSVGEGARPYSEETYNEYRSMLAYWDGKERDNWLKVGFAIYELRWGENGFTLWDLWSAHWQDKYNKKEQQRDTWENFGRDYSGPKTTIASIAKFAIDSGWTKPVIHGLAVAPEVDADELKALIDSHFSSPGPFNGEGICSRLVGPIRDLIDWTRDCARRDDPCIALVSAIGFHAASLGRRVIGPGETKPQLMIVSLAASGGGKDMYKQCINNLIHLHPKLSLGMLGMTPYHRAQFDMPLMDNNGQMIFLVDEYGSTLESWMGKGASMSPVIREVLSCGRTVFMLFPAGRGHPAFVEYRERWSQGVYSPSVSVLGYATPSSFYNNLSNASLIDGLLGRHIVIESPRTPLMKDSTSKPHEFPESISMWINSISEMPIPPTLQVIPDISISDFVESNAPENQGPEPDTIVESDNIISGINFESQEAEADWFREEREALDRQAEESIPPVPGSEGYVDVEEFKVEFDSAETEQYAKDRRDALDNEAYIADGNSQEIPAALLRRMIGQTMTMALVLACAESYVVEEAKITQRHIDIAEEICSWSARHLAHKVQDGVAVDDLDRAYKSATDKIIRKHPDSVCYSEIKRIAGVKRYIDTIWKFLAEDPKFVVKRKAVSFNANDFG